jgi:DNA-binding NtrC family response regulator
MTEPTPVVLVVEDEVAAARVLAVALERQGFSPAVVHDASQALARFEDLRPDAVLVDQLLPGLPGTELLRYLQRRAPDVPVILMTGHGDERLAVEAMRLGAFSYLPKPLDHDELALTLKRAVELRRLRADLRSVSVAGCGEQLLGDSAAMQRVRELIADVAPTEATVLICGETGTGKELVARALHKASRRARGRFVAVNCAAIPESLMEAELFGHSKGAFTGAVRERDGRFVAADGGTLFLDEIGDLPAVLQPKLLRVIEEREVTPLGSDAPHAVNVRLLAATHRNLAADVAAGRMRQDLYYRLNVVPIALPPLRDRREDIPQLVGHMIPRLADRHGKVIKDIDAAIFEWAQGQSWPGNVRELEHALERLVVFSRDGVVRPPPGARADGALASFHDEKRVVVEVFEREYLVSALEACRGRLSEVSRRSGISPRQLYNLLHKHGLASVDGGEAGDDGADLD